MARSSESDIAETCIGSVFNSGLRKWRPCSETANTELSHFNRFQGKGADTPVAGLSSTLENERLKPTDKVATMDFVNILSAIVAY